MIPNNRIESLIGIERRKKKDRDIIKCNKMGESSGMRGGVKERSGVERRGGGLHLTRHEDVVKQSKSMWPSTIRR